MNKKDKKAIIGVYKDHHDAIDGLRTLKKHHFSLQHVALVGKGGAVKNIDGVETWEDVMVKGTEIGGVVGGILGVLTGLTLVLVPEIGLIYAGTALGGAIMGGLEGGALGALSGNVLGLLFGSKLGADGAAYGEADPEDVKKYKKLIEEGKFLLVVHGPEKEIQKAHEILMTDVKFAFVEGQYLSSY